MSLIPKIPRASGGLCPPWAPYQGSTLDQLGTLSGPQTPRLLTPPITTNPGSAPDQCLLPLKLIVRIPLMARCTRYNVDKVCQRLAAGRWFSPGIPISSTNKTDHHEITEVLLKVALNTITIKSYKSTKVW
jgi:hypothetical protein